MRIKVLERSDISTIIDWARNEGFAPGRGDFEIYRNTDKQGMWMGWLGNTPVGCISAIRYNEEYGFIGLYLVAEKCGGRVTGGRYGIKQWIIWLVFRVSAWRPLKA